MPPPDFIIGIANLFGLDPNPNKIALIVGAYRDEFGQPYVLESVKLAKKVLLKQNPNHEYLWEDGLQTFNTCAVDMLYGKDFKFKNRVAKIQALSGTGSLRINMEFLQKYLPPGYNKTLYYSNPTWKNHFQIAKEVGFTIKEYPYFNAKTNSLDFEGMKSCIKSAPNKSVILLQACSHNPTGVDPTLA